MQNAFPELSLTHCVQAARAADDNLMLTQAEKWQSRGVFTPENATVAGRARRYTWRDALRLAVINALCNGTGLALPYGQLVSESLGRADASFWESLPKPDSLCTLILVRSSDGKWAVMYADGTEKANQLHEIASSTGRPVVSVNLSVLARNVLARVLDLHSGAAERDEA